MFLFLLLLRSQLFIWQAHNALFMIRCLLKVFIREMSEEELHLQFSYQERAPGSCGGEAPSQIDFCFLFLGRREGGVVGKLKRGHTLHKDIWRPLILNRWQSMSESSKPRYLEVPDDGSNWSVSTLHTQKSPTSAEKSWEHIKYSTPIRFTRCELLKCTH